MMMMMTMAEKLREGEGKARRGGREMRVARRKKREKGKCNIISAVANNMQHKGGEKKFLP